MPAHRTIVKIALVSGVSVAAAVTVLVTACWALALPSPWQMVRYFGTATSRVGELFPSRTVAASAHPRPLQRGAAVMPEAIQWKGEQLSLSAFCSATATQALLWTQNGRVVGSCFAEGVGPETPLSSWSVAKSIVGILVAQALTRHELQDTLHIVDVFPELRGNSPFDQVTVAHLMDMTSGIGVAETYGLMHLRSGTSGMFMTSDMSGFLRRNTEMTSAPGDVGSYRSVDTAWLGFILAQRTGMALSTLLSERLWQPMGAEDTAHWNLDHEGGVERAFCCLNLSARDTAKVGNLLLDGGQIDGREIIPAWYIEALRAPAPRLVDGWGYRGQWWHLPGSDDDIIAMGIYGQYIYVHPPSRTVVVKFSDYGEEQDEAETVQVFRTLAGVRAKGASQ